MSDHQEQQYQLVVGWHNPFTKPETRGLVFYTITLRPEVTPKDFETFVKAELAPAVEDISTRAIRYGPVYLLTKDEGGSRFETRMIQRTGVAEQLESLSSHTMDYQE
jgi:hypothetical protein